MARRMGTSLLAIVAESVRSRTYLEAEGEHVRIAASAAPTWRPDCELPKKHRNFRLPAYPMPNVVDLFTPIGGADDIK